MSTSSWYNTNVARPLARAKQLARRIIPDLDGRPVYVVQIGIDSGFVTRKLLDGRQGLWARDLDTMLRPDLQERGEWQGPGVAVAVDTSFAIANFGEFESQRRIVGMVLHELAHWLDFEEETPPTETSSELQCKLVKTVNTLRGEKLAAIANLHTLTTHDSCWQRISIHLWHRATHGGGYILGPEHLAIGNSYQWLSHLPPPPVLVDVLREECHKLRLVPLRDLAYIDPPQEFTTLWRDSVRELLQRELHNLNSNRKAS